MKKIANKQARQYVESLKPFKGSNLSAEIRGNVYVVLSYGYWPLFVCDIKNNSWYENRDRYSNTTSRHRRDSNPNLDKGRVLMSRSQLDGLIEAIA